MFPIMEMERPHNSTFYLPMLLYACSLQNIICNYQGQGSVDASSMGVSLSNTLLIGLTIHPSLVNVLLHFRLHQIALTADIEIYIELEIVDRDLHSFIWSPNSKEPLNDYCKTQVIFWFSASLSAANMAVKQMPLTTPMSLPWQQQWCRSLSIWMTIYKCSQSKVGYDVTQQLSDDGFLLRNLHLASLGFGVN